jgi:hypothetical protein
MKLGTMVTATAAFILTASAARAEHDWNWHDRFAYSREGDKFRDKEFSVDLFGSYKRGQKNVGDFFDSPEHGVWGGGIGANYFFTRMFGAGADVSMHADGNEFIDNGSANLIVRFPIEAASLAPYVFGGGGRNFDPIDEWEGHAGVGLEFRLNPHTGIFADGRYVWPDKSSDYSIIRAGFRFAF